MSEKLLTTDKTKLHIFNVFHELVEEKPLSQISITDIVTRSNISRQTFYRHFEDIYALLLWIFDNHATGCNIFDENRDFEESSIVFFNNLKSNKKFYRQLFLNDKSDEFIRLLLNSRIRYAEKQIGAKNIDDKVSFALYLFWSGHMCVVRNWLATGMKESPEMMGRYTYASLPEILKQYYH